MAVKRCRMCGQKLPETSFESSKHLLKELMEKYPLPPEVRKKLDRAHRDLVREMTLTREKRDRIIR